MSGGLLQNSMVIKTLEKSMERYRSMEDRAEEFYKLSLLYRKIQAYRDAFRKYAKESLPVKIMGREEEQPQFLYYSITAKCLTEFFRTVKKNITVYFGYSEIRAFLRKAGREFRVNPLKTIGLIGVTALITNIAVSLLLR